MLMGTWFKGKEIRSIPIHFILHKSTFMAVMVFGGT